MDKQETAKEPEQTIANELEMLLCNAAYKADDLAFWTHITGLHTAGKGWEALGMDIRALMLRAQKMPK